MNNDNTVPPVLGRPIQTPRAVNCENIQESPQIDQAKSHSECRADDTCSGRPGDSGLGRPIQTPREYTHTEITQKDLDAEQEKEAVDEEFAQLQQAQAIIAPRFIGRLIFIISSILAALIGFSLLLEGVKLIAILQGVPVVLQVVGYAVGFCLLVLFGVIAWQLTRLWRRLEVNQQIDIAKVEMSQISAGTINKVQKTLRHYLESYDLIGQTGAFKDLRLLGVPSEQITRLEDARRFLLEENRTISSKEWIEEYRHEWQVCIDAIALARVKRYSTFVAIKTAFLPYAVLDCAAVLYNSFCMLRDLCIIYQVRTGKPGTMYLLGVCFFQAFMAGAMNEAFDHAKNELWEAGKEFSGTILSGLVAQKFAAEIMGRVTEGVINGVFLYRVGKVAIRLLQPLN